MCLFTNISKYTQAHRAIVIFLSLFTPQIAYHFTVCHLAFSKYSADHSILVCRNLLHSSLQHNILKYLCGPFKNIIKEFFKIENYDSFLKTLLKYSWFTMLCLISAVQQSDSVIYIYILFHILFHCGLSQDNDYSSLCSTVGPCCLSILHIIVFIC